MCLNNANLHTLSQSHLSDLMLTMVKVAILESLDLWYDLLMATFIRTFLLTGGQLGSPPPS